MPNGSRKYADYAEKAWAESMRRPAWGPADVESHRWPDEFAETPTVSFALLMGGPGAPPALEERLPAREVARILGVKVETLAKWRYQGRGPRGWIRLSATLVVYPASEVAVFLAERVAKKGGEGR